MATHFTDETMKFLRGLKRNNDREWFEARRDVYERALRHPMLALVDEISKAMETFAPEHVRPANKIVMRIYRDTRFSKNKLPYKTHMAAWWARRGMEKTSGGGFYLQVGVDGVLAASGCYMPEREQLLAVRRWMSARHGAYRAELARLMKSKALGFSGIDAAALTRMPKGFAADDPADELLRAKSWGVHAELPSALALSPTLAAEVVKRFKASSALVAMLNEAILSGRAGEGAGDEVKARRPLF
jgi:uncharacterized protein (TIGR02453 family)